VTPLHYSLFIIPPPGIGLVFVTLAYQIYAKYKASKQAQL
jgi:hypothetical protein